MISREKIEELVSEYRESLIYFIMRYVGDIDQAEDLAEDVFVEIIVHPERFKHASSEKTYLYAIGRNKAIDYLRKNGRVMTVNSEEETDDEALSRMMCLKDETPGPEETLIINERKSELLKAMDEINPEYREALRLVYFEEMSYDDAGEVLKKTRKQIENLVYRGKKALREKLGSEGAEI